MGMLKDFRDFAMKGNVIDLAVGVIIGAAFGGIVNSLVSDVLIGRGEQVEHRTYRRR